MTGEFHLHRALCRMWREVAWRAPLTDEETALIRGVLQDSNRAYLLDSTLEFPVREWHELVNALLVFDDLDPEDLLMWVLDSDHPGMQSLAVDGLEALGGLTKEHVEELSSVEDTSRGRGSNRARPHARTKSRHT